MPCSPCWRKSLGCRSASFSNPLATEADGCLQIRQKESHFNDVHMMFMKCVSESGFAVFQLVFKFQIASSKSSQHSRVSPWQDHKEAKKRPGSSTKEGNASGFGSCFAIYLFNN